jgi:hypothetical protein
MAQLDHRARAYGGMYPAGGACDDQWQIPRRETTALLAVVALALVIRLYLSLTSYCISGDGVAYLAMARNWADGNWHAALDAVYSPLYPALISLVHRSIAGWEMSGDLVSAILGTGAVVTTYLMTREAFGRALGLGAAVLMALHPETAAYSASVRTEAGYFFWTTGACWLLFKSLKEQRALIGALAGIAAGFGYLYRTEAIGFLLLGILFLAAAGFSRLASYRFVIRAVCAFAASFILIAGPYLAYLRMATGHWTVGREFTAAMMYGMGDVARNGDEWRRLGWSAGASPLLAPVDAPFLYMNKTGHYLLISIYNLVQALDPLLAVMLAIGIWARRDTLFGVRRKRSKRSSEQPAGMAISFANGGKAAERARLSEIFLAIVVLFYFCGFVLSYTGTRFMVHLIPFTFGWIAAGIRFVSQEVRYWFTRYDPRIVQAIVPAAIILMLLPRTLWPIGYDIRGLHYAGLDIAQMKKGSTAAVAARDGRVAYYAGARLIGFPPLPPEDLCGWLRSNTSDFLMIGNHDEHLFKVARAVRCLELLKRYPRYGSGYYDLYAVTRPQQAHSNLPTGTP